MSKAFRLMKAMLEVVEELYLLSQCGTSDYHFITFAAMLIWADTVVASTFNVNNNFHAPLDGDENGSK